MILHHGFAQWGEDWRHAGWTERLAQHSMVITIDALGHGRSDRPLEVEPYTIESRARAVLELADHLDLKHFVMFGFSMGGRVAFELAASHPHRLSGLVVGAMHASAPALDRASLDKRARALSDGRLRTLERAVGATGKRPDNDPGVLILTVEAILEWRGAEDRLAAMRMPSLVFCGDADPLFGDAQRSAAKIPEGRFLPLTRTNHAATFYRCPPAVEAVDQFARGIK